MVEAVASVGGILGMYLSMWPFVTVGCFLFLDVVFLGGGGRVLLEGLGGFPIRMGGVSLIWMY